MVLYLYSNSPSSFVERPTPTTESNEIPTERLTPTTESAERPTEEKPAKNRSKCSKLLRNVGRTLLRLFVCGMELSD